ncbi:Helix-turn-helix domain-containing protein [Marininema mesophilum]|uniref:Helix-turn-helix domain-containing protein n=1 Tax=Marininema mesophilum TaxID=1048340 RepID=A0A1H3ATN1_9BACL|nr:winged helix-turn-helix domain-containing protein [Marininema mesophilum]SDX32778.1 Helix-turn-helix domain-containing protein [Marininema mesophilum]
MVRLQRVTDLELMKLISDPRRSQIMNLCTQEALSVKELAIKLGEEPSRLYYHVNKLVDHELLEVADTRQHGNLTEKLYRTNNVTYNIDLSLLAEAPQRVLAGIQQSVKYGFDMIEKNVSLWKEENEDEEKPGRLPYHVTINSGTNRLTKEEWLNSLQHGCTFWQDNKDEQETWPEEIGRLFEDTGDEKGTYQYVLISYRIEDGQKLGIIPSFSEKDEEKND